MKLFLSVVLAFILVGCVADTKPATPGDTKITKIKIDGDILDAVTLVTKISVKTGLKEWAKKEPASAQETATRLSANIQNDLLPYLNGDKLLTSEEVNQLLQASLFNKMPEPIKSVLIAAASVLDYYLPIPDAKTYLTKNDIKLVVAFLTGIKQGCDEFTPVVKAQASTEAKYGTAPEAKQWAKPTK